MLGENHRQETLSTTVRAFVVVWLAAMIFLLSLGSCQSLVMVNQSPPFPASAPQLPLHYILPTKGDGFSKGQIALLHQALTLWNRALEDSGLDDILIKPPSSSSQTLENSAIIRFSLVPYHRLLSINPSLSPQGLAWTRIKAYSQRRCFLLEPCTPKHRMAKVHIYFIAEYFTKDIYDLQTLQPLDTADLPHALKTPSSPENDTRDQDPRFLSTALHEIGHALGLGHVSVKEDPHSVMHQRANPSYYPHKPSPGDISRFIRKHEFHSPSPSRDF